MKKVFLLSLILVLTAFVGTNFAADTVPTDIQQPGTQPNEIGSLGSPDRCDNCHGGYNTSVEPAHNWRGSMMSNAGRDPIFWATVAIAEQDFDGAGDLCIRCHSTAGWLAGRSTPTDGSGLGSSDGDGVECDYCHKVTNPDNCEHIGEMFDPFIANDLDSPTCAPDTGYFGSGMSSMWGGSDMLGPYDDAAARHQFMQSKFHRDVDFCGTCHDVSNAAVGNLAPNHGTQPTADPVVANGTLGGSVDGKAAFNNFPYEYGIVERTFSEYKSGLISQTLVDNYVNLPADLQGGALMAIYNDATANGTRSANYEDGDPRYYSCQSCHMRPVTGTGCNKNGVPVRTDLPLHDMTGGNYWMPEAMKYLDTQGKLRLGGGLTASQITAMDDGALRAKQQLNLAASLTVSGNTVKVVNHTGHKLISGYPEGRRMWLNIKWYDGVSPDPIHEDGEYGAITVNIDGTQTQVNTILDLHDPDTKIYEAHYGMTQEWAQTLMKVNAAYYGPIVLDYDRETGADGITIADLAQESPGTEHETFHFVLNNTVVKDNRIPPYGMDYEEARKRNALPVPDTQYGGGPTYNYFDEVSLNPPSGAQYATVDLVYQPTSWEYIQFLYLANNGTDPAQGGNAFLGMEGEYMLEAWLNKGMAEPYAMASATWGTPPGECNAPTPTMLAANPGDSQVQTVWQEIPGDPDIVGYKLYYDQAGKAQLIVDLLQLANEYVDTGLTNGQEYCYKVSSYYADCESGFSNILCATPQNPGQTMFAGVDTMQTGKWVKEGKGKNATTTFVLTQSFTAGDAVVVQAHVENEDLIALPDATVEISINDQNGATVTTLLSGPSNADGWAEATWQTQKPNKKGQGGTPAGVYSAVTTGLTVSGYAWDEVMTSTTFCIDNAACSP
jgi:hypothetical protein